MAKFRSLTLSAVQPMLCTWPEHGTRQQFLVPRFTDGTFIGNPGHLPMAGGADLGEHQFAPDRANRLRIGSSAMTTPLLEVRHLKVELHSRRGTLLALDDVSFDIAPGEILGVVGESGAGKSLTGAAIIGLLEPPGRIASGEVLLGGERIDNTGRQVDPRIQRPTDPARCPLPGPGCEGGISMTIQITGDEVADRVLTEDPFALLLGMLLDQQYPMEHAFRGPAKLLERFGTLEPARLAAVDPAEFAAICATPPAVHRFPGSMAARIQAVAALIEEKYDGRAARLWSEAASGRELLARVTELPGFGTQKAQIFVALLAKQLDVRPEGWEAAVGAYAEPGYRSVADVTSPESLQKVRAYKKAAKQKARESQGAQSAPS